MMEFYNNSFSNNYMNQKTFPDLDCDFSFSLVQEKDYSCSFSEFDYIKRVKKSIKNENLEKHFFEETKNNKEKITKNKSISSFRKSAESIFKQKSIEILEKRSEKDSKALKLLSIREAKKTKLNKSFVNNNNFEKENKDNNSDLGFCCPKSKVDLEYSFDFLSGLATPKKKDSWGQAENLVKSPIDSNSFVNINNHNNNHSNYQIYEFENFKSDKEHENEGNFENNYDFNNYNNVVCRKKSDKEIFESFNSLDYEKKENANFNKNIDFYYSENYKNNKTDKKITNNELNNFNYKNQINNLNKNKNNFFINKITKTNLNGKNNEKTKSETNIISVSNKSSENEHKIKNEEKQIFSDYESLIIEKLIISKILQTRSDSVNKIIKNYRIYKAAQLQKEEKLIKAILQTRIGASVQIQSAFRSFFVRKNMQVIINKLEKNYIFLYDYNKKYFQNSKCKGSSSTAQSAQTNEYEEEPNHDIKLQLLGSGSNKAKNPETLSFEYSKFLRCYMLVFKKKGLIRRNYKVNFIVNGNIIIDPRFKLDADEDGKFYNVIESHMLLIKNKIKAYENKLRYIALQNRSSPQSTANSAIFNPSANTNHIHSNEFNGKENNNNNFSTPKKPNFENPFNNQNNTTNNINNNKTSTSINKNTNNINNNKNSNLNFSLQESKYWEDIFKIKVLNNYRSVNTNSVSDASESQGDVDRIFTIKSCNEAAYSGKSKTPQTKSSMQLKPSLKKQNSNEEELGTLRKSVSFDENVQISFFTI